MARNPFAALANAQSPAVIAMADGAVEEDGRRADANETTLVANALVAAGIDAIMYDYPDLQFRALAPVQGSIGAGAESYTWQEYDITGQAMIVANKADNLPDVGQYAVTNTGVIRTLANSYSFTKRDLRRVVQAKRSGQQAAVLDVDRIAAAREIMERTKDRIAAVGDTASGLPGILKGTNVTVLTASTPASGTSKAWNGGDKTGQEVLKDLRTGIRTVATQSKGAHRVTHIAMSVEYLEYLATLPLAPTTSNQTTVIQEFMRSQSEMGNPIKVVAWNRCATADAANTGNRVLFLKSTRDTVGLVEPLPFETTAPQAVGLEFKIACESEFGGIFFKKTLAAVYMDFV